MISNIFFVFRSNLIKMAVTLTVAFIIPNFLSVEEYGYYKLFLLYTSYIGISHFGFCDGVFIKYGGKNLKLYKNEIANEQKTFICYELAITLLVILIGSFKKDLLIILFGLEFLPSTLISYYSFLYQSTGDLQRYSIIYSTQSILLLAVNIILIYVVQNRLGIMFSVAIVIIDYIVFIYSFISFNRRYDLPKGNISFKTLTNNMKIGILLMFGNMAYIQFQSIDKWYVKEMLGLYFFSLYSFASQLLSAINMFANPIGLTLYSYMSQKEEKDQEHKIKKVILAILYFMLNGVFILLVLVENYMVKYIPARNTIIILFLAQVFLLFNTIVYVNLYKVYKKQREYFINLFIVLVLSIGLNATFFYIWKNMESFALATLVSMVLWSFINLRDFKYIVLSKKEYLFILVCSIAYLGFTLSINPIAGMICYFAIWYISFKYLMEECYRMCLDILKGILNLN